MDRIYEDKELITVRFACNCLDAGHNLTISLERDEKTGEVIACELSLYAAGKPSLWWRMKSAWQCLKGKDGNLGEFFLRKEDYPAIINLLSQLVKSVYTAGT